MKRYFLLTALSTFVASLSLVGCGSHNNPLLTAKKAQAVKFLVAAQDAASQKTHLYDSSASVYVTCVQNPAHFDNPLNKSAANPCGHYFQEMVDYAKQTQNFKGLKVSDLKDPAVAKKLAKPLIQEMVNSGF